MHIIATARNHQLAFNHETSHLSILTEKIHHHSHKLNLAPSHFFHASSITSCYDSFNQITTSFINESINDPTVRIIR